MKDRIEHWEKIIVEVTASYKRLDAATAAAINAGCLDINGNLWEAIWINFDTMLEMFDCQDWIKWWIWDNECGNRNMNAACPGQKPMRVKSPRQLARIIAKQESNI